MSSTRDFSQEKIGRQAIRGGEQVLNELRNKYNLMRKQSPSKYLSLDFSQKNLRLDGSPDKRPSSKTKKEVSRNE